MKNLLIYNNLIFSHLTCSIWRCWYHSWSIDSEERHEFPVWWPLWWWCWRAHRGRSRKHTCWTCCGHVPRTDEGVWQASPDDHPQPSPGDPWPGTPWDPPPVITRSCGECRTRLPAKHVLNIFTEMEIIQLSKKIMQSFVVLSYEAICTFLLTF